MIGLTPQLQALFAKDKFYMADLFTLTLIGGDIIRYTSHDQDIVESGRTFKSVHIARSKTTKQLGIEVDQMDITLSPSYEYLLPAQEITQIKGMTLAKAIRLGALDGAQVILERAFFENWITPPAGTIVFFTGHVSDVPEFHRDEAQIKVKSIMEQLNEKVPSNVYKPGCQRQLYDTVCDLNKADWAVQAQTTTATSSLITTNLTQEDGYFDLGWILLGNGDRHSIRSYLDGQISLIVPMETALTTGDTFWVYPGCDKRLITCIDKFNNLNFRGFPFVPMPEAII